MGVGGIECMRGPSWGPVFPCSKCRRVFFNFSFWLLLLVGWLVLGPHQVVLRDPMGCLRSKPGRPVQGKMPSPLYYPSGPFEYFPSLCLNSVLFPEWADKWDPRTLFGLLRRWLDTGIQISPQESLAGERHSVTQSMIHSHSLDMDHLR